MTRGTRARRPLVAAAHSAGRQHASVPARCWFECHAEEGCLLRLRANFISADQVSEEERVLLVFDGPELQCVESTWGRDTPEERCGGEDLDCDGFIDEGLACSGVGE